MSSVEELFREVARKSRGQHKLTDDEVVSLLQQAMTLKGRKRRTWMADTVLWSQRTLAPLKQQSRDDIGKLVNVLWKRFDRMKKQADGQQLSQPSSQETVELGSDSSDAEEQPAQVCPHCPNKFQTVQALHTHINQLHSKLRSSCPFCHKKVLQCGLETYFSFVRQPEKREVCV